MESVSKKIRIPFNTIYTNLCSQKNKNVKSFILNKLWTDINNDVFDSSSQIVVETEIQIWILVIKMISHENTFQQQTIRYY